MHYFALVRKRGYFKEYLLPYVRRVVHMSDLLEVKNLKKYYGDSGVAALNGLSINFERG